MSVKQADTDQAERGQYRTRAMVRGLTLLSCFTPMKPELSLAELAERAGLDKATAFRLLASLVDMGFLRRDGERGIYQVGPAVLPVASAFQQTTALAALAEPHLRALANVTRQTATLAIPDGSDTVNVALAYSDRPLRRLTYVGERYPLHSTAVGKVIAAAMREDEVTALLETKGLEAVTPKTITEWPNFLAELRKIRETNYALDDEEAIDGVRCLGAVVRDYTGRPVGAVSVAGALGEFEGETLQTYIEQVQRTAGAVSAQLGHVPASAPSPTTTE